MLLDPTYGEYSYVLEKIIECRVERFTLKREVEYQVDIADLVHAVKRDYDLIVLVNPNNPTGRYLSKTELVEVLRYIPCRTLVWIDEAYLEYVADSESCESLASDSDNVIVCKSMSKVYALSGARVSYLCAASQQIAQLRPLNPPWAVSLPAQVAAVHALQDPAYYQRCYRETILLREQLACRLSEFQAFEIIPGAANLVLCHLKENAPGAESLIERCQLHGLFLRNVRNMGSQLGDRAIRIAVKDPLTIERMIQTLAKAF